MVPVRVVVSAVGPLPMRVTCPACRQHVLTFVSRSPNVRTHMCALLLCLFGCWPMVCVPYCLDDCNSTHHYCPNCGSYIGTYDSL